MTRKDRWYSHFHPALALLRGLGRHALPFAPPRRVWVAVHRSVALTVGVFFVLMGLTGSLNVFQRELDAWMNPALKVSEPRGPYRSPDALLAAIHAEHPRRIGSWTLAMPERPDEMVTAWFERPAETYDEYYAPLMVSINPYTAEVVANRFWGNTVMTWILELHSELFMGRFGRAVIGCFAVLLVCSLITGLSLWWPGRNNIRRGLQIRSSSGRTRRWLFDVHRAAGVYGAGILLLVALTGLHLVFPGWLESVFKSSSAMGDIHDRLDVRSQAVPDNHPVTLDAALLMARGLFPSAHVQRLMTPDGTSGSYQIWFGQPGTGPDGGPTAVVCVDQFSGHILHVENLSSPPAGDTFLSLLRRIHTGTAFGLPGRILWSIAGWIPLVLYVTGIQRWQYRRDPAPCEPAPR